MTRFFVGAVVAFAALVAVPAAVADGTETLGPPTIAVASGTGFAVAGLGTHASPDLPASFDVSVPAGATVKQVLLYWQGHWTDHAPHFSNTPQVDGDNTISVNGNAVLGTKIGGSTAFFQQFAGAVAGTEMFVAYRADITSLGLVGPGANTLTLDDMLFRSNFPTGFPFNQGNNGAGVLVIYDDGGNSTVVGVRDGLDLAFTNFAPPLDTSVPQTFTFAASANDWTARLGTMAGSVLGPDASGPRANQLVVTFAPAGAPVVIDNPWQSNDGFEFDAPTVNVTVPAGATSMTVQGISGGPNGSPASFAWSAATLSLELPPPAPAALGDFVWDDLNANGIQDAGEPGLAGVTVRLSDCAGTVLASTATDANGLYLFSNLAPGGYRVEFVTPSGYVFSPADQGANDALDSDANTTTGLTGCTTLSAGETNRSVDAGMNVPQAKPAVFLVIDEDGIDNGDRYWLNSATSFTSSTIKKWSTNDVNDDRPGLAQRLQLRWFADNVGKTFWFWTGQVGDEGWFAPKVIPPSWAAAGPTSDGLRNLLGNPTKPAPHDVGKGLGTGSDPEKLLDKIPYVAPLRAEGLYSLIGRTVCALVWDSDISINYGPLNGSLKGEKLGVVAFEVHDVVYLPGFSSSTLPRVQLTIRDANQVCVGPLTLFNDAPEPKASSVPMDIRPNNAADNNGYYYVTR